MGEFIELIHTTMSDFNKSKKLKKYISLPSIGCVEGHIQNMPEFPDTQSFPEIPAFMKSNDFFDFSDITNEDIPSEAYTNFLPALDSLHEYKKL
jgi:hypothetical protein